MHADPAPLLRHADDSVIRHAGDATFDAEVLRSALPVVVDFWAPWCAPCTFLGQALEEVAPAFAGRLRVVKINVDENPRTADRYGIRSIPALIFFDGGRDVAESTGAMGAPGLHDMLSRFLAERGVNLRPA